MANKRMIILLLPPPVHLYIARALVLHQNLRENQDPGKAQMIRGGGVYIDLIGYVDFSPFFTAFN